MKKNNLKIFIIISVLLTIVVLVATYLIKIDHNQASGFNNTELNTNLTLKNVTLLKDGEIFSNISLVNVKNDSTISLYDRLTTKSLIFYFDPEQSCYVCIDKMLELLKAMSINPNNTRKIILVSKYKYIRDFKILRNRYKIDFDCLNTNVTFINYPSNVHVANNQVMLLLNKNKIEKFYIIKPSSRIEKLSEEVFKFTK